MHKRVFFKNPDLNSDPDQKRQSTRIRILNTYLGRFRKVGLQPKKCPATLFNFCSETGSMCVLRYLFQPLLLRYILFFFQTSWTRSSAARWLKDSHPGTSRCSQAATIVIVATIVKINHSLNMYLLFPIDGERYSTFLLDFLLEAYCLFLLCPEVPPVQTMLRSSCFGGASTGTTNRNN